MIKAADVSILIGTHVPGIGQTLRMALRGAGVRVFNQGNTPEQFIEACTSTAPDEFLVYIDSGADDEPGMRLISFARRSEQSPNRAIPIVVVSQSRDIATIHAVANAGAHEYALFPASGEQLLKKVHVARTSTRLFIDTPEYVGPERRVLPR